MVFTSSDVAAALVPSNNIPAELTAPVIVKKLGYIVDFARIGVLTRDTTMNDIVKKVTASQQKTITSTPSSPSRRSVQVFDKKAVPTLDKFSGHDEDYFTWQESTINMLGTAGFGRFLDDDTMISKHPEVAESVFYSLRGAVHGGQAQSIAQGMLDDKQLDPASLWSDLEDYYNTALNRANVVLFDICCLLNLRLDPNTTATKFISDFCDCLQRLRKNNARLSEDNDTLRALLLVAIQDDDNFEMVWDSIVHKPESTVDMILTEIQERETSLMMKDQASNIGGDGANATRFTRRIQGSSAVKSSDASSKKWSIPRYPDSWKKSFGTLELFKLLIDWRTGAHKGQSQQQLNNEFSTVVESYRPGQGKSKSCRASANTGTTPTTANTEDNGDNKPSSGEDQPRKQIWLQKSRQVVTERSA